MQNDMDPYDPAWNALCNVQQRESLKHSRIAKVTQKLNEKLEREQLHHHAHAQSHTTPDKIVTTRATSVSLTQVWTMNTRYHTWKLSSGKP